MKRLRVVLVKPSKYDADGSVARFKYGLMPNATLYHLASMIPGEIRGVATEVHLVDEYVETDLGYLRLLEADRESVLLLLVGVQSHQFHRALDLAAFARSKGVEHCVIGGPHSMTCDTSELQGRGLSFALSEAEVTLKEILEDATRGELKPVYGGSRRWARDLEAHVVMPPTKSQLKRYWMQMFGIYPVRGCPYTCNFCSVIKIAGRAMRSNPIDSTLESLRLASSAGVSRVMFTSDNFNKYPEVREFCEALARERLPLKFLCQCDSQIAEDPDLVNLLGQAGCEQIFVGVESFDRQVLRSAKKFHNRPERYRTIIDLCAAAGIESHFSNIIGFPEQNRDDILEHLAVLRELDPRIASFYILCPIPGTEQYDDFMDRNLIWEQNLDRFDGTCPTWQHPHLEVEELAELLRTCYAEFYSAPRFRTHVYGMLNRYAAKLGVHPMAGGVQPVAVDRADEYRALRCETFGIDRSPLPRSLHVSAVEALRFRDEPAAAS